MAISSIESYNGLAYCKSLNSYQPTKIKVSSATTVKPMQKKMIDNNSVSSLTKARKNISTEKKEFINKTLSEGKTLTSVSKELEFYNKQLKEVNKKLTVSFNKQKEINITPEKLYRQNNFNTLSLLSLNLSHLKVIDHVQSNIKGINNNAKINIKSDSEVLITLNITNKEQKKLENLNIRSKKIQNAINIYKQIQTEFKENNLCYGSSMIPNANQQQAAIFMNA